MKKIFIIMLIMLSLVCCRSYEVKVNQTLNLPDISKLSPEQIQALKGIVTTYGNSVDIRLALEGLEITKPIEVTTDAKATVVP